MEHVAVIGAGAFGTALAAVIGKKGHKVSLWSFNEEACREINENRINKTYLPGVELPETITAYTGLEETMEGAGYMILATPSLFTVSTMKQLLTYPTILEGEVKIATVAKGFLPGKNGPELIVDALENYLPGSYKGNLVYISGPSHAEEVGRGKITGLISASLNANNSILYRELLAGDSIKIFSSLDVVGVQTCAAIKNVVAIAFGVLDAMKDQEGDIVGDNTESLLFAAGLNEIQTLGRALGSTHPETFTSIAGVGDLDVTCRSVYGRNRRFGREIITKDIIGKYKSIEDLLENIKDIPYLPEGVFAARHAMELIEKHNLKLPLITSVYKILNKEAERDLVKSIFTL
ncbi:MAG: NAD(P)-dependent glycerol-3-phosphate dehydrogenase [Spirochaetales bacterium]|nr:NAD(P)-dependent glycerol-3-phosphate dehydrogenase [Spirochaetales bacterium]